jgi:hypothetical protein
VREKSVSPSLLNCRQRGDKAGNYQLLFGGSSRRPLVVESRRALSSPYVGRNTRIGQNILDIVKFIEKVVLPTIEGI